MIQFKTTLYVEPMQGHLRFAFTGQMAARNLPVETAWLSGTLIGLKDLVALFELLNPDETLIGCGYNSADVKSFSAAHDIPYPATIEQRLKISQFTQNIPQ